jgi:hypothetical protein
MTLLLLFTRGIVDDGCERYTDALFIIFYDYGTYRDQVFIALFSNTFHPTTFLSSIE